MPALFVGTCLTVDGIAFAGRCLPWHNYISPSTHRSHPCSLAQLRQLSRHCTIANGVPFQQRQPRTYTNTIVLFYSCASCASLIRELIMLSLPPCPSPPLCGQMYRRTGGICRHTVGAAPLSSTLVAAYNKHRARRNRLTSRSTRHTQRGASYRCSQRSHTHRGKI